MVQHKKKSKHEHEYVGNPWEYQIGFDTPASFDLFRIFRDMGPTRTLPELEKLVRVGYASVMNYSNKKNWIQRCEMYDLWVDRQKTQEGLKIEINDHIKKLEIYRRDSEALGWQNLRLAQDCIEVAQKAIEGMLEDPERINKLKPIDIRNLVSAATSSLDIGNQLIKDSLAVSELLEEIEARDDAVVEVEIEAQVIESA